MKNGLSFALRYAVFAGFVLCLFAPAANAVDTVNGRSIYVHISYVVKACPNGECKTIETNDDEYGVYISGDGEKIFDYESDNAGTIYKSGEIGPDNVKITVDGATIVVEEVGEEPQAHAVISVSGDECTVNLEFKSVTQTQYTVDYSAPTVCTVSEGNTFAQ